MQFRLPDEQQLLKDMFARLFAAESTPERVRAAEESGFDGRLWEKLVELGALAMRVDEHQGGSGMTLFDATIVLEQCGRHLGSVPLAEAIVATRMLSSVPTSSAASSLLSSALDGDKIVIFVPMPAEGPEGQVIMSGSVADAAILLDGHNLLIRPSPGLMPKHANLGDAAVSVWQSGGDDVVLASGPDALRLFGEALEEWRILTAAALVGLARRSLELAADYAREREQFGRPIGSFQGIAHPLAEAGAHVEGAGLLVWRAVETLSKSNPRGPALCPMSLWAAADASSTAVARALHAFGGYGLSVEYDIQLYHRRAKSMALAAGDPRDLLLVAARRLWSADAASPAPGAGKMPIDFDPPAEAIEIAERTRAFFDEAITPALRAHAHHSWEGHDKGVQQGLARAGLLFPDWPTEFGGQGASPYVIPALGGAFHEAGWTRHAISVTDMVGRTLMAFGGDHIRDEVLPSIARGDAICSFGFTEPDAGSDVFAAKTRATRDGEGWRIDGQKMFTSGADIADYVLLLTRTDPEASKHRGLTLFLVPLKAEGVEVQAVQTISDERTNITYYDGVRIPDGLRVGPVDGGAHVLGTALAMEHADSGYPNQQRQMVENAMIWARKTRRGGSPAIDDPRVAERLARAAVHAAIADLFGRRSLWGAAEGEDNRWMGPMSKLYSTETYIADATDLLDLAAPASLLRGNGAASALELDYRVSTATSIYGGSSEIMRSIIAESYLSLPRTRI